MFRNVPFIGVYLWVFYNYLTVVVLSSDSEEEQTTTLGVEDLQITKM
jgi:hypothetical protein